MKRTILVAGIALTVAGCTTTSPRHLHISDPDFVYVCHGNKKTKWLRVAAPAAKAHAMHGDFVTMIRREQGAPCKK